MNRGIYLAPSSCSQLAHIRPGDVDRHSQSRIAEIERIERVLRKSQSAQNVRALDPSCPAPLIARAFRLSNLYGVSPTTKLARKGAGERLNRKKHEQLRKQHTGGSPGSSREGEEGRPHQTKAKKRQRRVLQSALDKARDVALRLTWEDWRGVKAFDGPSLTPADVKDLFWRNFRVKLSTPEAEAMIVNFCKKRCRQGGAIISIEHGEFLQAFLRLRRDLLKKQQGNGWDKTARKPKSLVDGGRGPESSTTSKDISSLPLLSLPRSHPGMTRGEDGNLLRAVDADTINRALAKVDRAALSYDPRRIENLRQADLSRVSTPRAFGGVLLARFDVRVDPVEQSELVTLLQDENGTVDVERFRTYFLGLIEEHARDSNYKEVVNEGAPSLPPLF
ncbi:unnamed protein product, partial [Ectocarpus fasciculatus]